MTNTVYIAGPQNFVIVARRTELRLISLDTLDHTAIVLPIRDMRHVIVIEYDPVERFVYWTDQDLHLIKRAKLDGSGILTQFSLQILTKFVYSGCFCDSTSVDGLIVCNDVLTNTCKAGCATGALFSPAKC